MWIQEKLLVFILWIGFPKLGTNKLSDQEWQCIALSLHPKSKAMKSLAKFHGRISLACTTTSRDRCSFRTPHLKFPKHKNLVDPESKRLSKCTSAYNNLADSILIDLPPSNNCTGDVHLWRQRNTCMGMWENPSHSLRKKLSCGAHHGLTFKSSAFHKKW